MYYRLDENREVVPATLDEWVALIEGDVGERRVAESEVAGFWVSTVFTGLEPLFGNVFETAIFDGGGEGSAGGLRWMERASSWAAAEERHREAVEGLRAGTLELWDTDDEIVEPSESDRAGVARVHSPRQKRRVDWRD